MKNGRLFEILYLLVEKRAVTAGELARRFEVSERTIYRDIDALSAAGIPVYTQRGQGGGIRLMDQFVLDRVLLSPQQQDEVLFALQAILAVQRSGERETLSRLSTLFRREGSDWLEVDFADWGSGQQERAHFQLVKQAILGRRRLTFTYYSSFGQCTRRTVEPAKLVFKAGCWYLQAFCLERRGWRVFRLVRMEQLQIEDEVFSPQNPPAGVDAPPPSDYRAAHLRLLFRPGAVYRVRDYFHPSRITAREDGCLLVECAFPEDSWLMGFLLSFGDQVEVLSPDCWRDLVKKEAEKISALYKTGHTLSYSAEYPLGRQEGKTSLNMKEDTTMEERKFCQCCGMPLDDPKDRGTEANGSPSQDYCCYCYKNGAFTAPEATMEDMIAFNLKYNAENGHPFGPQEQAERNMRAWFPTLKRWKQ